MTVIDQSKVKNTAAENLMKMNAKIKEAWSKLTEDDIKLYNSNRDQFFERMKTLYSVTKADAEKRLMEIEKACGCSSSADKSKAA